MQTIIDLYYFPDKFILGLTKKTIKFMNISIQRVLISVSDKRGIVEFAQKLHLSGTEIISTGGTAALLKKHQIPHIEVSEYTQFREMMDGRVKTLHPKIHAGILARLHQDESILNDLQIPLIDAVVVNLYPFQQCIENPNHTLNDAIDNIDIGGPTLIRAAAKNYERVTVIVDPDDYPLFIHRTEKKTLTQAFRFELAQKAFAHTATYDGTIANYLGCIDSENPENRTNFPLTYHPVYYKKQDLRYGENPHQKGAIYKSADKNNPALHGTLANATLLQGKPLSYNNLADADGALNCLNDLNTHQPACVIVKHANPCGVAIRNQLIEAYRAAYATDPSAAFGGIIAINKSLDAKTAQCIIDTQFVEVIIVPQIDAHAATILKQKPNIRVLTCGLWKETEPAVIPKTVEWHIKKISGGLLIQSADSSPAFDFNHLTCVTQRKPTEQEMSDLHFAWKVVKNIQSNAIIYARNQAALGIGAGQMSRIDSVRIGLEKARQAGFSLQDAVMASDAFFPFRDGIDTAVQAGISAIIQPGGSLRDSEVIAAADEADIAMVFTKIRHFRH